MWATEGKETYHSTRNVIATHHQHWMWSISRVTRTLLRYQRQAKVLKDTSWALMLYTLHNFWCFFYLLWLRLWLLAALVALVSIQVKLVSRWVVVSNLRSFELVVNNLLCYEVCLCLGISRIVMFPGISRMSEGGGWLWSTTQLFGRSAMRAWSHWSWVGGELWCWARYKKSVDTRAPSVEDLQRSGLHRGGGRSSFVIDHLHRWSGHLCFDLYF